jgi:hypothetical protein
MADGTEAGTPTPPQRGADRGPLVDAVDAEWLVITDRARDFLRGSAPADADE